MGKSTLISSGITMLFFLDRRKEASVVFLLTAAKKLVEFICYGFWIYRINFLSLFLIVRSKLIIFQRVPGFFWCNLTSSKMWFLSASRRVFLTKLHDSFNCSSQQCPVFDESFEEAASRFHKILDFLVDQTTGSDTYLPVFDESFEEAASRFHKILDFLVDQTTGSATNLNGFHGSMDVWNGL